MDYIIFGIGASATLVLVGWLLRDWGPKLRDRTPGEDDVLSASELVTRMAWARFCATCGMALLFCGVLVMLVTMGALLLGPSDDIAAIAVVSAFGLAGLLMLIWTWLYLRQFGSTGVLRPVEKRKEAPSTVAVESTVEAPADGTPAPGGEPAPTFAEAAASPGGLGRFAAFFRRDAGSQTVAEPQASEIATSDGPAEPAVDGSGTVEPTVSPTDAVIAELSGESGEGEEKRLSEDDPLVTSVRAATSGEPSLPAHAEPGPSSVENQEPASPGDREPSGDESSAEAPSEDRPAHELALENLRRRRLARLAKEPDTE